MRSVVWTGLGLAFVTAVAGGLVFAGQQCGPLDRSGCVAAFTVADMTGLGDTVAVAPNAKGQIWVAGSRYAGRRHSGALDPSIVIALLDAGTGAEITRLFPSDTGTPTQMTLSPDGARIAIANSTILMHSADLIVLDAEGETLWSREFDEYDVVPDAEGRAFALSFGPEGELFADPLAFNAQGEPIAPQAVGRRWIEAGSAGVALPAGFVPWTYATVARSSDGMREAVLVRRFDRGAGARAVLAVRDVATGATIVRHEIGDDLNAALAWDPLGRGVIVARAGALQAGAGTQLRIYAVEAKP
ncbi:hypothetical protein QEZ48_16245 [Aquamicrobium lusatiense]|uniref:hypothetical protein n=1 Tax=Aquamicrobium lusatiense TaxID=89772 RepID=UPI00245390AC|nr:hypothetical protein [Aquamicrobium lusatiense]MDH4992367.1 hypothetical protein [Aquamicrobium lusatiense]